VSIEAFAVGHSRRQPFGRTDGTREAKLSCQWRMSTVLMAIGRSGHVSNYAVAVNETVPPAKIRENPLLRMRRCSSVWQPPSTGPSSHLAACAVPGCEVSSLPVDDPTFRSGRASWISAGWPSAPVAQDLLERPGASARFSQQAEYEPFNTVFFRTISRVWRVLHRLVLRDPALAGPWCQGPLGVRVAS